jgi:hypothetical protein
MADVHAKKPKSKVLRLVNKVDMMLPHPGRSLRGSNYKLLDWFARKQGSNRLSWYKNQNIQEANNFSYPTYVTARNTLMEWGLIERRWVRLPDGRLVMGTFVLESKIDEWIADPANAQPERKSIPLSEEEIEMLDTIEVLDEEVEGDDEDEDASATFTIDVPAPKEPWDVDDFELAPDGEVPDAVYLAIKLFELLDSPKSHQLHLQNWRAAFEPLVAKYGPEALHDDLKDYLSGANREIWLATFLQQPNPAALYVTNVTERENRDRAKAEAEAAQVIAKVSVLKSPAPAVAEALAVEVPVIQAPVIETIPVVEAPVVEVPVPLVEAPRPDDDFELLPSDVEHPDAVALALELYNLLGRRKAHRFQLQIWREAMESISSVCHAGFAKREMANMLNCKGAYDRDRYYCEQLTRGANPAAFFADAIRRRWAKAETPAAA